MVNSFNIDGVDIKYKDMTAKQILYVLKKIEKIRAKGIEVVDEKTGYIKKIKYTEVDEYFNVPYLKKELEFLKNKI